MKTIVNNAPTLEDVLQITPEQLLEMGSSRIGDLSKVVYDEVYQLEQHLKYDQSDPAKTRERQIQHGRLLTLYKMLIQAINYAIERECNPHSLQLA